VTQKYEFIDAEYASPAVNVPAPTIVQMCRWLDVSKSGFYEWRSRPESATAQRRELLKVKIEALFYANDETYGYRRLHQALVRGGEQAGDELVRKLMRELGLEPCQPRPWRHSLTEQGPSGPIPDLVNRGFTADKPGEKMVGDISAPRGALPYRPRSGRRQEEVSSGLMAYPEPKGKGDHSTPENR
jgi:putative transposase